MGLNWAEHSEEIDAPIETCFDAIVDYESFPRWQDAVDSVEVLDRTADGLGHRVHLFVDAKVRKIDYVLAYRYERPVEAGWDFVEGNGMNAMEGAYTFERLGPERTRARYNLGADPAIPVPGMIMRRTHRQLVKRSVEDLKREAERRHAAGEGAGDPGAEQTPEQDHEPPERPAAAPPADDWVPKAAREASAGAGAGGSTGGPAPPPGRGSGSPADAAGELLSRAAATGKQVAEGAMRAGVGAVGEALELGAGAANRLLRRINDKLGDRQG